MFQLRDEFVLHLLPTLDSDSLRVALALLPLPARGASLTAIDLAFRAGITPARLAFILRTLAMHGILNEGTKIGGGAMRYTMSPVVDDHARTFRLEPAQQEDTFVASLLDEKQKLVARLRRHSDDSGLADKLSNAEEAATARMAEEMLGRALNIDEAYAIGKLNAAYGPARVLNVLTLNKNHSNPVVGTAIMLHKGSRGKPFAKKDPPKPLAYFSPEDSYSPW